MTPTLAGKRFSDNTAEIQHLKLSKILVEVEAPMLQGGSREHGLHCAMDFEVLQFPLYSNEMA